MVCGLVLIEAPPLFFGRGVIDDMTAVPSLTDTTIIFASFDRHGVVGNGLKI